MKIGSHDLALRPMPQGVRLQLSSYGLTLGDALLPPDKVLQLICELQLSLSVSRTLAAQVSRDGR